MAALRLPLPRGDYRLRLATQGLRPDAKLQVAFNGTRVEVVAVPGGDYELPIERAHCHRDEQTVILLSSPLRPWLQGVKDYRELGLPLFAIETVPVAASADRHARVAA